VDDRARLPLCDLDVLAIYLFGPRWQSALARAVHRSDRQVRRWVAQEQPVSLYASALIEAMVRNKHSDQLRRLHVGYLNMIASLSESGIRSRLLALDLTALHIDDQLRRASLGHLQPKGTVAVELLGSMAPRAAAPPKRCHHALRDPVRLVYAA
jgi:hypothetical protein